MNKKFYYDKIKKLKSIAELEFSKKNYNSALEVIDVCARIMYEFNQEYTDQELEDLLVKISNAILNGGSQEKLDWNSDTILFYDGFGLNSRGLAQIYLKALCQIKKVIYVTYEKQKDNIPDLLKILDMADAKKIFISEGNCLDQIQELNLAIKEHKPQTFFMYTMPNDVVVTTVFAHYTRDVMRYQINLTDHAFWLGKCALDKCIEFRDYGAYISNYYRNIKQENIVKIPFYPQIDYEQKFEDFPFEVDTTRQKVIFSGGALYKTIGGQNRYYKIIDYILKTYPDTIFWYAGSGNKTEMNKLVSKYPKRVYLTTERKDLYQVLRHCFFYLSTYPICGGLMFQYAAMAEKIPLTLVKSYEDTSGFLLFQEDLEIEFDTLEEVYKEIDCLFTDDLYRKSKESRVKNAVVTEEKFTQDLRDLVNENKSSSQIVFKHIDTREFRKEYWDRQTKSGFYEMLARRKGRILIKYFGLEYVMAVIIKIKNKLRVW